MLLALDGMGHYPTADIGKKWSAWYENVYSTITIAAEGRFGNCLRKDASGAFASAYVSMSPRVSRLGVWTPTVSGVVGFAYKIDHVSYIGDTYGGALLTIREGAYPHLFLYVEPDGTLVLFVDGPYIRKTAVARSAEVFQDDVWVYLEVKWVIDASAGSVIVRADGMEMINYTGRTKSTMTLATVLGVWTDVRLLETSTEASRTIVTRMCDFYLADLESAETDDVSDFLGDGTIDKIRPNGVGDTVGWTPLSGDNYENVNDDTAHDGDSTYNSATTPGTIDIHHYEDVPADAVILATQHVILARKVDEGVSSVTPQCKINTTTFEYVEQGVPDVTYSRYLLQPIDVSPDTGAKFTAAELNGAQFGIEKTS